MLRIVEVTNRRAVAALLAPSRGQDAATDRTVARIVTAVRRGGDKALLRYTRRLDGLEGPLEIRADEIRAGAASVPTPIRQALKEAARHIRAVARRQVPRGWRATIAP